MGTPVPVVAVLSRASVAEVETSARNSPLKPWISVWPALARFCTKVL